VNNDFHETHGIFPIFDGLQVQDMDKAIEIAEDVQDTLTGNVKISLKIGN
jgi:hypothetical protein